MPYIFKISNLNNYLNLKLKSSSLMEFINKLFLHLEFIFIVILYFMYIRIRILRNYGINPKRKIKLNHSEILRKQITNQK